VQTYLQFKNKIKQRLWPSGEPLSLVGPHDASFQFAMLDLQKAVPCLKQFNTNTYESDVRFWENAKTYVDAPFGQIRRVYTVAGGTDRWRDKVFYRSSTFGDLECWARRLYMAVTPINSGLPILPYGVKKEEAASDSPYGRARIGAWAIHRRKLFIAPWLQTTETLIVEWDGEKRQWQDSDGVDETIWRQDAEMAVQAFVAYWHEKFYGDRAFAGDLLRPQPGTLASDYILLRSELMYECRENTRQQHSPICESETGGQGLLTYVGPGGTDSTDDDEDPTDDTTDEDHVLFAAVGDMGDPTEEAEAVADAIEAETPERFIALGDNTYNGNYTLDFAANYQWAIDQEILIPVPGNHDWDVDDTLDEYKSFFADFIGNNGNNYEAVHGPIHFFIYDTDSRFADGFDSESIQAEWLRVKMLLSTARWKIVLMHRPPFSSSSQHGSDADLQLAFKDWGAHVVIAGHDHLYERLNVDGLTYIVVGTGGRALYDFGDTVAGSLERHSTFGYLIGEADCDTLVLTFKDINGDVLDTVTITHEDADGGGGGGGGGSESGEFVLTNTEGEVLTDEEGNILTGS
jgi:predicted phosphodiesterase